MTLFLQLLPFYLLGNLHCIGMCGPLVMMLGKQRYRYFYFLGRILSFSLAGMIAGEIGAVLNLFLQQFYLSALLCFLFGGIILLVGISQLLGRDYPGHRWLAKRLEKSNRRLSLLMLQDRALPSFLFGFFTLTLPCGQTLVVFSACALNGNGWIGLANGLAFALLTSPSLLLAMHAHSLFRRLKRYYNPIMGICALMVAFLSLCRGFADLQWIDHRTVNLGYAGYHLVIY